MDAPHHADGTPLTNEERLIVLETDSATLAWLRSATRIARKAPKWLIEQSKWVMPMATVVIALLALLQRKA